MNVKNSEPNMNRSLILFGAVTLLLSWPAVGIAGSGLKCDRIAHPAPQTVQSVDVMTRALRADAAVEGALNSEESGLPGLRQFIVSASQQPGGIGRNDALAIVRFGIDFLDAVRNGAVGQALAARDRDGSVILYRSPEMMRLFSSCAANDGFYGKIPELTKRGAELPNQQRFREYYCVNEPVRMQEVCEIKSMIEVALGR